MSSTFVIPNLNTGNVTQQRLQGNQNALAIQSLQNDVTALQSQSTTATFATNTYTSSQRQFGTAYQNTGTSSMLVEFTVQSNGAGGTASVFKGTSSTALTQTGESSIFEDSGPSVSLMLTFVVGPSYYYKVTRDVNLVVLFVTETNL
jgi:microcystin-dependent protein